MRPFPLIVIACLVIIIGCKKETATTTSQVQYKIKKVFYIDSVLLFNTTLVVTHYIDSFVYDSQDRLISKYDIVRETEPIVSTQSKVYQFSYAGSSNLPSGYTIEGIDHVLSYAQQLLVRDSIINPVANDDFKNRPVKLSYQGSQVIQEDSAKGSIYTLRYKDTLTMLNDDIMVSKNSNTEVTFTYSNVSNPYYELNYKNLFSITNYYYLVSPKRVNAKHIPSAAQYPQGLFTNTITTDHLNRIVMLHDSYRNRRFYYAYY